MTNQDHVILVDDLDNEVGSMPKLEAHEKGLLHRAFSIFLFNSKGEMLLQQRAFDKYHSAGLWSNTCCSHPYINESVPDAAHRRLKEEMGLEVPLNKIYSFVYNEPLENGLIEHEYDHVFSGISDDVPKINPLEVANWKYIQISELQHDMNVNPTNYTIWFRISLSKLLEKIRT